MITRYLERFIVWVKVTFVAPAVEIVIARLEQEIRTSRTALDVALRELTSRLVGEMRSLRHEVRMLNEELVSRPATREQMDRFDDHVVRLDDQVAHLAALMFGKTIADQVTTRRGPREFTTDYRQEA